MENCEVYDEQFGKHGAYLEEENTEQVMEKYDSETDQPASGFAQFGRLLRARTANLFSPWRQQQDAGMHFLDPDIMKQKVREQMLKAEPYDVTKFYHKSGIWQRMAKAPLFEHITLSVICMNAIWIAVDTDWNDSTSLLEAEPIFQTGEQFFCFYFAFEWFVRFKAFRKKIYCLGDGWFVFDSVLVLMMVLETWLMTVVLLLSGSGGGSGLGGASVLRLVRLLRLTRMARMLRSMPELMILIKGMVAATRSVFFVMCLLMIITYMFAIALKQLSDGTEMGETYFPGVATAMYSLWVHGTLLDDLSGICMDMKNESYVCLFLFNVFVLLAALTVMNMLIGVLCEVVAGVASTEKESMMISFVQEKLQQIMKEIDDDCDLQVSRTEFLQILDRRDACKVLQELDVDPEGMVDNVDFIFDNDCGDGEEKKTFGEFMEKVLQLRGGLNSTVKDIVELRRFVKYSIRDFQQEVLERLPPAPAQRPVAANGAAGSSTWEIPAQPSAPAGLPPSDQPTRKDMERLEEMMSSLICEVRSMRSEQQQYQRQLQALPGAMSPDLS
mmetsp:Transcript_99433/g.213021  ORF Transcript_99433/g.213021 Transcript_99433/m.213021 type:complete len:555 (-) Transcript_99433:51-1715(-)